MGAVILHNVVSVDGFIAGPDDDVGPHHEWYFEGDTPIAGEVDEAFDHSRTRGRFQVSRTTGRLR